MLKRMSKEFFIAGNVPSLKNGKVKTKWGLIASKAVRRYQKERGGQWFDNEFRKEFLKELESKEFPVRYICTLLEIVEENLTM